MKNSRNTAYTLVAVGIVLLIVAGIISLIASRRLYLALIGGPGLLILIVGIVVYVMANSRSSS